MVQVHPVNITGDNALLKSAARSPTSGRLLEIVETSPCGRFARFNKTIRSSELVQQYLGYDLEEGVEVTWNVLRFLETEACKDACHVLKELEKLKTLDHPNVSHMNGVWMANTSDAIVYTTDLPTSKTLKQFIGDYPITLSVLKRWCISILEGLKYLHEEHDPPVVHGYLTCDNIYINGASGKIRIGGLEWSCLKPVVEPQANVMKRDIAAFGLCVLDIITQCSDSSISAISTHEYNEAVDLSKPPSIYERLLESSVKSFVNSCIVQQKPASLLLKERFLLDSDEGEFQMDEGDKPDILCRELISA